MAKFCMHCGAAIADEAKFCANCGQSVQPAAPAQQVAPPQSTYQEPVAPAQPTYQEPVYQQPVYQPPSPKQQNSRTLGIFALVLGIICFLASLGLSTAALIERYAEEDIATIGDVTNNMVGDIYGNMGLPSHITDQATNKMNSATNALSEVYGNLADRVFETYLPFFIGFMVLGVLGMVFGILAIAKGYRSGISVAGMILSILAVIIIVVTMIVIKSGGSDAEDTAAGANNSGLSSSLGIGSGSVVKQDEAVAMFRCDFCGNMSSDSLHHVYTENDTANLCDECYELYQLGQSMTEEMY